MRTLHACPTCGALERRVTDYLDRGNDSIEFTFIEPGCPCPFPVVTPDHEAA